MQQLGKGIGGSTEGCYKEGRQDGHCPKQGWKTDWPDQEGHNSLLNQPNGHKLCTRQ